MTNKASLVGSSHFFHLHLFEKVTLVDGLPPYICSPYIKESKMCLWCTSKFSFNFLSRCLLSPVLLFVQRAPPYVRKRGFKEQHWGQEAPNEGVQKTNPTIKTDVSIADHCIYSYSLHLEKQFGLVMSDTELLKEG